MISKYQMISTIAFFLLTSSIASYLSIIHLCASNDDDDDDPRDDDRRDDDRRCVCVHE